MIRRFQASITFAARVIQCPPSSMRNSTSIRRQRKASNCGTGPGLASLSRQWRRHSRRAAGPPALAAASIPSWSAASARRRTAAGRLASATVRWALLAAPPAGTAIPAGRAMAVVVSGASAHSATRRIAGAGPRTRFATLLHHRRCYAPRRRATRGGRNGGATATPWPSLSAARSRRVPLPSSASNYSAWLSGYSTGWRDTNK